MRTNLLTTWQLIRNSLPVWLVLHKNIAMMTNRHSVPGLLVLDDIKGNFGPWGAFYFRKPDSSKMSGKLKASKTTPQSSYYCWQASHKEITHWQWLLASDEIARVIKVNVVRVHWWCSEVPAKHPPLLSRVNLGEESSLESQDPRAFRDGGVVSPARNEAAVSVQHHFVWILQEC